MAIIMRDCGMCLYWTVIDSLEKNLRQVCCSLVGRWPWRERWL